MAESSRGRKPGTSNKDSKPTEKRYKNEDEKPHRRRRDSDSFPSRAGKDKESGESKSGYKKSTSREDKPERAQRSGAGKRDERRSSDKKAPFKRDDRRKPAEDTGNEKPASRRPRIGRDSKKPPYAPAPKDHPEKKFNRKREGESDSYKPAEKRTAYKPYREDKERYGERTEDKKKYLDSKYKKMRLEKKAFDKPDTGEMRLNKYIANSGICSRREADELIKTGLVKVNGKLVLELGTKVKLEDVVQYNGQTITPDEKVYIIMNKPKDYITTTDDPQKRNTVMELLDRSVKVRVFPVGRLDRNTTGVLLLTNDGDMTKKLIHPSFNKKKVYHVFLDQKVKSDHIHALLDGITLDDGFIKVDAIQYVDSEDKTQVGVEIHSGKYHIIKRIFEHFEYKVVKLDRVYFAGLTKKGLNRGQWRYLTDKEITMLKMGAFD